MNTTEVGDRLEKVVYDHFVRELAAERLPYRSSSAKVFRQKGYFSRDRNSEIVFDVSMEVYQPGCDEYSVLVLVECKNYSGPVGVGEVEEFFQKAQQVSGGASKCVLVANGAFQKGVLEFARSKKIALVRHFGPSEFKWLLPRASVLSRSWNPSRDEWLEIENALVEENYASAHCDFYGAVEGVYSVGIATLLYALLDESEENRLSLNPARQTGHKPSCFPRYVPDEEIEAKAMEVLGSINYAGGSVDLARVCDLEKRRSGLLVLIDVSPGDFEAERGMLGRIRFDPPQIDIFVTAGVSGVRRRFTLAHELGHHFMDHGRYMSREYLSEDDFGGARGPGYIRRLEAQANRFAEELLMPKADFMSKAVFLAERLGFKNKGHGLVYVDRQKCNVRAFYALTDALMLRYSVSRSAARVRLSRIGLLNDVRSGVALGSLLSEI